MCKLIGISGGSKRNRRALAWILANAIEEMRKGTTKTKFDILYRCWVDLVDVDHAIISSTNHVIIDSFGDHILDQVKQFCPALIPYDLHDDNILTRTRINPFTFEIYGIDTAPTHTAEELWREKDHKDAILSLDEFIMYFAHYTMKTAFGERVWLNVAAATVDAVDSDDWRIYEDCKTQAELDYIKESGGTIVSMVEAGVTNMAIGPSTFIEGQLKEQCDQIFNFINNLYGIQEKS